MLPGVVGVSVIVRGVGVEAGGVGLSLRGSVTGPVKVTGSVPGVRVTGSVPGVEVAGSVLGVEVAGSVPKNTGSDSGPNPALVRADTITL